MAQIFIERGLLAKGEAGRWLALQQGYEYVNLTAEPIDVHIAQLLPEPFARRLMALPIRQEGKDLIVAMADPSDILALDEITRATGLRVQPVVSRVKILAALDIAEHSKPQDGRITMRLRDREYDVRVGITSTAFGERVVMRLLDKTSVMLGLERLGIPPDQEQIIKSLIRKPHGMILVTGPTGSGKTTTLYSCLHTINDSALNIITIEDPVEYYLDGISQIPVRSRAGVTFATGLRSILRQDPDIVMVGEIRDAETAKISVHAALTGHLVFSTLHTNDAAGSVERLVDMGIEPYFI